MRFLAHPYEIPAGRTTEFASIQLKFEDTERNLFDQIHTFTIFHHNGRYSWGLAFERLTMVPFSKRSHIMDDSLDVTFPDDSTEIIYERASSRG